MKEKIKKLKTLKTILGTDNLILTGSVALAHYGLVHPSKVDDLDVLLLTPTPTQIEVLNNLQKSNPNPKFFDAGSLSYSFIYDGVKIDIWIVSDISESDSLVTNQGGIKVASVPSIVKAKVSYNRPKDWVQLQQIAKLIFNPLDFSVALDSINTQSGNEYDKSK